MFFISIISVVLVTGGSTCKTSVKISAELLSSNGTRLCALPNLPAERIDHSQTGLLTCGGHNIKGGGHSIHGGSQSRSCITLSGGRWKYWKKRLALGGVRFSHAAVALPQGVLFTGGYREDLAQNLQVSNTYFYTSIVDTLIGVICIGFPIEIVLF